MITGEIDRFSLKYPHLKVCPDLIAKCELEFTIQRCKNQARKNKHHFCSKKCSQYSLSYGKIRQEIQQELSKDNLSNVSQREVVRRKNRGNKSAKVWCKEETNMTKAVK